MRVNQYQAADLLNSSHVVALPTETVYGLAASLEHEDAINTIFTLKQRPLTNPLIVHVSSHCQVRMMADGVTNEFEKLVEAFWPGPMTLVLPIDITKVPYGVRAGLSTAAFRMPAHELTLEVISNTGPLVMPSANISGKPSATKASHVEVDFGLNFPVLDGGPCKKGLESTILIFKEGAWSIIRLGAIPPDDFEPVLGYVPEIAIKTHGLLPLCPGQLFKHYAPNAHLKLEKTIPTEASGVVLGFSDRQYPKNCELWSLSESHDPKQAAATLYALLRKLDEHHIQTAWVDIDFPQQGLWITLMERLQKASCQ